MDFFNILDSAHTKGENPELYPEYSISDRNVQTVQNAQELNAAIKSLSKAKILGFDSEQKPTFKKNAPFHGVATIQLASQDECYVIQIKQIKDITPLIGLLEDESIVKVGINLDGDREALYKEFKIKMRASLEIDKVLSKLTSKQQIGAKRAAKIFLNKTLQKSKKMTLSNWENKTLTPNQIKYAAEDASVAYDVTIHLLETYPFVMDAMPNNLFKHKVAKIQI